MAGLGRKVFAAGEVLTAANVQGYLMDQTVMVFDDATDRTSTLGTAVSEGMLAYTKDDNSVQVYDGSSWTAVDTTISSINNTAVVNTLTASTATAYTIQPGDQGTYLQFTAGAGTITVGTATGFSAGQTVQIITEGTAWSILPEGTAVELYGRGTAQGTAGFLAESPYDAFSIISVGTNAYRIIGNVSAV
jgi:hypothetical protein